jgi:hypothetical protein
MSVMYLQELYVRTVSVGVYDGVSERGLCLVIVEPIFYKGLNRATRACERGDTLYSMHVMGAEPGHILDCQESCRQGSGHRRCYRSMDGWYM